MMKKYELDRLVICNNCHTVHQKIPLHQGAKALCSHCNAIIYRQDNTMIEKTLAITLTAFISLLIAFQFTILTININGLEQSLTLTSLFVVILENEQYLIAVMLVFLIVIFPLMILLSLLTILTLMKLKKSGYLVKRLLILLAHILPWSMVDIFFISILVAMVKLFDYAKIELGIAFGAFILTLILDIFITKNISFYELWNQHDTIYGETHVNEK